MTVSSIRRLALLGVLIPALAGCGLPVASGPPVTTDPNWVSNRAPESPNSFPPNFLTNRPFPPASGIYGVSQVVP